MAVVVLPTPLQERAGGAERVPVEGATAAEALRALESRCPQLRGWILDERGRLRPHVSLFVGDSRAAPDRPLNGDDELWVVQAISGGSNQTELDNLINDWTSTLTVDQVEQLMIDHSIPAGKMYRAPEMLEEWDKTKSTVRQTAFLHEKEFAG